MPLKLRGRSVPSSSTVALTIATFPFDSSGTWMSSVSMLLKPRLWASSRRPWNKTNCFP